MVTGGQNCQFGEGPTDCTEGIMPVQNGSRSLIHKKRRTRSTIDGIALGQGPHAPRTGLVSGGNPGVLSLEP
jgi:hypothetical protein